MAGPKFWTSTVLLAFISLSGASEPRRCYWCGPLAEQVHRSRRSAACRGADPVTACDPGYDYCAVVATSPPRVESRFCVKMYQDECYSLYCNTTKTWKMTCPCRGDLCNGPNTEREIEAFALLPKLVAKTHNTRIKKRTANSGPFIIKQRAIIPNGDSGVPNNLIVNESVNQQSDMQADQANIIVEHHEMNKNISLDSEQTTANQLIEIEIHVSDPTVASDKMNVKPCTDSPAPSEDVVRAETDKQEVMSVMTTATIAKNNEASIKTHSDNNMVQSQEPMTTETTQIQQDVVVATEKPQSESMKPTEITSISQKEEATKAAQDEMQNDAPIVNPTDTQQVQTTEEVKVDVSSTKNSEKPSSKPTAEALQQNVSSAPITEKATQPTTEATTVTTTMTTPEIMAKMTTTPASRRKNGAAQLKFNVAFLLSSIIYF